MILVTGGTGLVGSHLLYQICQSETKVRAIKRAQSNTSLVRQIFSYYTEKADLLFEKIEWVNAELLNIPELDLDRYLGTFKQPYPHYSSIIVNKKPSVNKIRRAIIKILKKYVKE